MITIKCRFKIRDKAIKEKIEEYIKRIRRYEKLEIIENYKTTIKDENRNVFLLDEEGEEKNSKEFATLIKNTIEEYGSISFIVGPPEGFKKEEKIGKKLLKISSFTLQHELCVLVLVEQIYRAITINRGIPYHKE